VSPSLLSRCTDAWIACHGAIAKRNRGGYDGLSPDEILHEAGVTFEDHRRLYLMYERAIRRAAWTRLGGKYEWVA